MERTSREHQSQGTFVIGKMCMAAAEQMRFAGDDATMLASEELKSSEQHFSSAVLALGCFYDS